MKPTRSFMRRQGRMIPAQKCALEQFWPQYGITGQSALDLDALFGRRAPRYLEIGFGMGEALLEMAQTHLENDYLGIEVHLPGIGRLLQRMQALEVNNIRIDRRDAMEVLDRLPSRSLAGAYLFFPDPWTKKRHHKRRLVQSAFIEKLQRVLQPGAIFHAATDCEDYACHMVSVLGAAESFFNRAGPGNFHPRPTERPTTKFEQRSLRNGQEVRDLLFERL